QFSSSVSKSGRYFAKSFTSFALRRATFAIGKYSFARSECVSSIRLKKRTVAPLLPGSTVSMARSISASWLKVSFLLPPERRVAACFARTRRRESSAGGCLAASSAQSGNNQNNEYFTASSEKGD